jgi:anti-sigma factor RsiW
VKISENVVMDLLPVYLSGEASPDTKELIEEFLRQHPEFARVVEEQKREFGGQRRLLEPAHELSSDHELQTLKETRSLIERQKWMLGVALMLTGFPFSFAFSGSHLTFILLRDQPLLAVVSWLGAAVLWIQYWNTRRRLRGAGLSR